MRELFPRYGNDLGKPKTFLSGLFQLYQPRNNHTTPFDWREVLFGLHDLLHTSTYAGFDNHALSCQGEASVVVDKQLLFLYCLV